MPDLRAESMLHALLEASGGRDSALDLRRMARIVEVLRGEVPGPSPAFRRGLRARLLDEAARRRPLLERLRQVVAEWDAATRRSLRVVVALATVAAMLLGGGAVFALAERTIPGQTLYPLKLAREATNLWFTRGDEPKGLRHLALAERRVDEIGRMAAAGIREEALYTVTLERMDLHTVQGAELLVKVFKTENRTDVLALLKRFAEAQSQDLAARLSLLPPGARDNARDSLALLAKVDQRANDLLRGCPCPANPLAPPVGVSTPEAGEPAQEPSSDACEACGQQAPGGGLGPSQNGTPPENGSQPKPQEPVRDVVPNIPQTGIGPVDELTGQVNDDAEKLVEDLLGALPSPSAVPPAPLPPPTTESGIVGSEDVAPRVSSTPEVNARTAGEPTSSATPAP